MLGAWAFGFVPVVYLALRGGGYDTAVYSKAGLAVWWFVLLGLLVGVLPRASPIRRSYGALTLMGAFVLWTVIASAWSGSAERTMTEIGRLSAYLAFFVGGLCVVRRRTVPHLVNGVAVAFATVSLLAVLSRLYPGAFPADQIPIFFPGATSRLDYPFNYANGTGNFIGMGIPLLLLLATRSRTALGQGLGAAALSIAVLGLVMTASRGGILTAVIGTALFYVLSPNRVPRLITGLLAGAGASVLVVGLLHRSALRNGLSSPVAVSQRHQQFVLLVIVAIGVALVQTGIALATRSEAQPFQISRRQATVATMAGLLVAIVIAVALGVPGRLSHQWQVFKQTDVTGLVSGNVYTRLDTVSGSHRYQYWQAAVQAFDGRPVTGIGPGTFRFYWAQHGSIQESVLNAHSLYLETLAETGLVGGILIVVFLGTLLITGALDAFRASPSSRAVLAAATASVAGFCAACAYDWVWQLPAIPVAALLLGAAILERHRGASADAQVGYRGWGRRGGVVASGLAIVALAIPLGGASAITTSQAEVRDRNLQAALNDATTAESLEPYAATPRLQEALIYEQAGDLSSARRAIAQATSREPTNWQIWLVRARIDAESGQAREGVQDYRRAHKLNPRSPLTAIHA